MFVPPALSDDQAIALIAIIFFGLDQNVERFLAVMFYLLQNILFRLRAPSNLPLPAGERFQTARIRFHFYNRTARFAVAFIPAA